MKKKALFTIRTKYTLGGILFGLSFPIFSQFMDCLLNDLSFSWASIVFIHETNVIHYVVDTAPLVLGTAGFLLGKTHQNKNHINARLREINDSLDNLTYKITHDLRGPALNIKNLAELLKISEGSLPIQKQEEILNKIHKSVAVWLQTFEDFMSLLRHEKSGELEKTNCLLEEVILNLEGELAQDIQESGAQIVTDLTKGSTVFASKIYLVSIFKNLIANAIKYAHPDRSPVITITSSVNSGKVKLEVGDNGTGIDLGLNGDKLFTLFERFNENSSIQGSGIGLYLVKEQVEKNNGTIEVRSILDEGTIFTIHLPIQSND